MSRTAVKVTHDTWKRLNARKSPGDTFEDVIQDLLDDSCDAENVEEQHAD